MADGFDGVRLLLVLECDSKILKQAFSTKLILALSNRACQAIEVVQLWWQCGFYCLEEAKDCEDPFYRRSRVWNGYLTEIGGHGEEDRPIL